MNETEVAMILSDLKHAVERKFGSFKGMPLDFTNPSNQAWHSYFVLYELLNKDKDNE